MNFRNLAALAALGSVALLGGALISQYFGGLAPCPMCIWQRWPHGIAIGLGAVALLTGWRLIAPLGAAVVATGAGIGVFHTGVERGWWEGPTTCTSNQAADLTTDQLLEAIMAAPMVRCDEVAWEFLTLSMASWNAIISLGIAGVWLLAWRAGRS
ncbi:disulfide bond formation protein B [bacterium]|nr:disulfide bond formation protein B [bacterium]